MGSSIVHEIRVGPVRASIWQEDEAQGISYSVSVSCIDTGERHSRASGRFAVDHLPLVAELMDLAHFWILEQAELISYPTRNGRLAARIDSTP
jgi:hypothetical protein